MSKNSKGGVFVSKKKNKKNKKQNAAPIVNIAEEKELLEEAKATDDFEITDTPDTEEEFVDFILDEATVVTIDEPFETVIPQENTETQRKSLQKRKRNSILKTSQ